MSVQSTMKSGHQDLTQVSTKPRQDHPAISSRRGGWQERRANNFGPCPCCARLDTRAPIGTPVTTCNYLLWRRIDREYYVLAIA